MDDPTHWYEIRFRGEEGPLPKFYTLDDADACAWLAWDNADRKRSVEVLEVDGETRLHILTIPPPEEGRA